MKNEMLALILAGGQGTRLGKLTQSIAKPAVQFGVAIVSSILPCQIVPIQDSPCWCHYPVSTVSS